MMPPGMPAPPINLNGGNASAETGDQVTGAVNFGAFNYNDKPPYLLFAIAGLAAVWLLAKR
jgi:hypothetical protein